MKKNREMYRGLFLAPRSKLFLVMKLTFLFLVIGLLEVQASVNAQVKTVDLNVKEMALWNVFEELKKQTDLDFFFSNRELDMNSKVTIQVKEADLMEVLSRILGQDYQFEIMEGMVIIKPAVVKDSVQVKSITLRGFVQDEKKQPMPGVTIQLAGTTVGAASDVKGWFAMRIPMLKGKLEFSFVGYKKQVVEFTEKMTKDTIRITMKEDISDLDEVVVRAYGTQNKREVVSAISTVTSEEMKELPTASITSMLQGRLAGVNIINQSGAPGSAAVIAVRGFNSLLVDGASDGQPLWVIDGVPMHSFVSPVTGTNTLADLDPSMIESVQVLKDAAAASIYGSRAGNGVILVTTKKGKTGKAQFSANVSYSISQLMEYPVQTGGRMERWLDIMHYRNVKAAMFDMATFRQYWPNSYESVYSGMYGSYDKFWGSGQEGTAHLDHSLQDSLDPYYNNSENWWKHVFRTGKVINANIQAAGGTDRFRYMVGLGYYDEKGIAINSGYKRTNILSNLSFQFTPKLRMDTRIYLAYIDRSLNKGGSESNTGYEGISVDPTTQHTYIGASDELKEEWLARIRGQKDRTDDYRAMVTAFMEYESPWGLAASISGSVDFSQGNKNTFTPSSFDEQYHENVSSGQISRTAMLLTEGLLRYKRSIKEQHNIEMVLGINANKEQNFGVGGSGRKGPSDDIYYYTPVTGGSVVNHGTEDSPKYVSTMSYSSDFTEKKMLSYFGRLGYNYKQRYLFEFTYRADGSSTFGEDHRWADFPSVAVGWTFSEEPFIKNWTGNWLNWGKIRGSYGTSGQIFTDPYLAHGLMKGSVTTFLGNVGMNANVSIAPDLTWEKTEQYDIGLDLDMFNYRLNLKLDYYYKYTKSLIYKVPLPGGLYPFSTRMENAMEISNEGIELELQADIFRESAVSWRTKFNISRNWNRFEKSYTDKDIDGLVIGRPLSGLYVYAHEGFYESEDEVPRYYTQDGTATYQGGITVKSEASGQLGNYKLKDFNNDAYPDVYYAGSTLPLVHGGWVNEIKWKGFDLNMLVNYSLGRKMINSRLERSYSSMEPRTKLFDYRKVRPWSGPGYDANTAAFGYSVYSRLDSNIEKVNYLSLKQLTLGYNVPDRVSRKVGFSGIRCFMTVENLFYLSNYSGENPEIIDVYSGIDSGMEYPLPRKWTLGLTINF